MSAAAANVLAVAEGVVALFALHALWQVPLLTGAAWCAVRVGRPQARVAHAVWVSTLLLCVVLPTGSTVAGWRAARAAARVSAVAVSYEPLVAAGDLPSMQRESAWKRMLHRHLNARDGLQPFAVTLPERSARIVSLFWLLTVTFFSAQTLLGLRRVRALVRDASPNRLPGYVDAALRLQCRQLRLTVPSAKLHCNLAGPVLAGVLRPTLLLPSDAVNDMNEAEMQAVLAHELAHLRRRDPAVHAACSMLLLPVSFHPVAFWAARCVRQTREMACDAEAAARMGSLAEYAWALLRIAEHTSTRGRGSRGSALFSNGLFGAGLQLFTNRGAMEERMQMLMSVNGSSARARAARVVAGVSLASVAVLAAAMLQVQPTLAAERSLPQAAATQKAPAAAPAPAEESESALIGGEHAREQLRRAQRQLRQAESQATSAEERRKIEGAQQAVAVAEQALSAADSSSIPDIHVDLSGLDHLNLQLNSPEWKAQLEAQRKAMAKLQEQLNSPEWKAQMDKQREAMAKLQLQLNSPEWKAQLEKQHEAMGKLQAQLNSPEWKAQLEKQRETMAKLQAQLHSPEFRAQIEQVRTLDRTKIEAMVADARRQQEKAMEQIRSGALQRQIDEARLMARLDAAPATMPWPDAASQAGSKPIRISPGVMAGNRIGGPDPVYPAEAKEKRVQGAVVLHVIIDNTGHVESAQVVNSPDETLSKSAMDAVQQWTYKPYLLNGNPMSVDTAVTVNFSLGQ